MNGTTVVIGLELDERNDALTGRITGPDGEVTEFCGWVGLIAALDGIVRKSHESPCDDLDSSSEGVTP